MSDDCVLTAVSYPSSFSLSPPPNFPSKTMKMCLLGRIDKEAVSGGYLGTKGIPALGKGLVAKIQLHGSDVKNSGRPLLIEELLA